jgi:hypothetical protein
MLGQNLRQLYESLGPAECVHLLSEGIKSGEFKTSDFSLRELAEAFCGEGWVRRLNPAASARYGTVDLLEAGEGVDITAFSNITGQIFYNRILEGWRNATLLSEQLTERIPTTLDGEKMPWLSHVISEGEPIHPGMPYPEANFGERYITTPSTTKYGLIVSVTKEMIFFDRTGQALRAAGEAGFKLGYNKEKRVLNVVLGLVNNYSLNGTTYNTYLAGPQSPPAYANTQASTPLVDYTSIQTAITLASQILDPDTGNPLDNIEMKQLLVMPARLFHAKRLAAATEYRSTYPGFQASAPEPDGNVQMIAPNPVGPLQVVTSPIAYQLLVGSGLSATQANEYWFVGDFKRAFAYMENWPITVVQAPANSIKEFEQDLVVRFKASERGTPAVLDPRYVFKLTNT